MPNNICYSHYEFLRLANYRAVAVGLKLIINLIMPISRTVAKKLLFIIEIIIFLVNTDIHAINSFF